MVSKLRFIARMWYYFRIGYATYLTFILGALNTLVVVWYLALQQVPSVTNIFGHFAWFAVVTVMIGSPVSIAIGWIHFKRIPAYSSEQDIIVEANPYNYRLPPGYWTEVWAPLWYTMLVQQKKLLESHGLLTNEERTQLEELERKVRVLMKGGSIGAPRRNM